MHDPTEPPDPDGEPDVEVLQGGVGNAGAVIRVGPHVLRPAGPHALGIHALLRHVRGAGLDAVPEVVGVDPDGRERLVYLPGDVPIPPFPSWSLGDTVLASTAALLRRFHEATRGFVAPEGATWSDELADPTPGPDPVMCHNDVCPENVVYRRGRAVALLDFEFAAPGRAVHDVAALARMCVPVEAPEDAARTGRGGLDPIRRLVVVADAYGLDHRERIELVDTLARQFERGGEFVRRRVEAGEPAFVRMWTEMGGEARFERRRRWFSRVEARVTEALLVDAG